MTRISEKEYIAAYGKHIPVTTQEVEAARDILRAAAYNKAYIPPTNAEAVFRELAKLYQSQLLTRTEQLVSSQRELTVLKRANGALKRS